MRSRSRLFRKYALLFSMLVSSALIASGLVETYFSYQETRAALLRIQEERAKAAASVIAQFVNEIEGQLGWTMHATFLPTDEGLAQLRIDYLRLLRQAPAITEVSYIDAAGHEQILVSRLVMDVLGSGKDLAEDPGFQIAQSEGRFVGAPYFRRGSEPYLTLALGNAGRDKGVTVAEVNLKFIWDVVSQIEVGRGGQAFVVDARGFLIAHPDIALVLRMSDLSNLPQVAAARADQSGEFNERVGVARGIDGGPVLSAFALIAPLGWLVFVESPLSEAFAPLYASLARTGLLLVVGVLLSVLAALLLARRIVTPIRSLQQGVVRMGGGEFDQQIEIKTGDELEDLADQFNQMGDRLRELYGNLERVSQLKRYFSPHLAELIVSSKENILKESHRQDITVLFCDLRNFTAFSSVAEPEVVMQVLSEYYESLGTQVRRFEATVGHFSGDGLMAFLNDPLPCPDHQARAVRMAVAMRENVGALVKTWQKRGIKLGFGIGIASGYATMGHIGSKDQFHYTAIGPVVNLASRLCDEAEDGQILMELAVFSAVEMLVDAKPLEERSLKGFFESVSVLRLLDVKDEAFDALDRPNSA